MRIIHEFNSDELAAHASTSGATVMPGTAKAYLHSLLQAGYLETLVRVTNDYMQVSDVLTVLGKSFNVTGLGAVALSESLISAAGGMPRHGHSLRRPWQRPMLAIRKRSPACQPPNRHS